MPPAPAREFVVRLRISRSALAAQIRDFLEGGGVLCSESIDNPALLISDAARDTWEQIAEEAERLGARALILCTESEAVARSVIPQACVKFLERPFAWRELRLRLDTLAA